MSQPDWVGISDVHDTLVAIIAGFRSKLITAMPEMHTHSIDEITAQFAAKVMKG